MDARERIAVNIRRLRVAQRVAGCLRRGRGIDWTYVSRIERRLENPTVLERIAAALDVEIAVLFADPGPDDGAPPSLPAGRKRRKLG